MVSRWIWGSVLALGLALGWPAPAGAGGHAVRPAEVSITSPTSIEVKGGERIRVQGVVTPARLGTRVRIQQQRLGTWVTLGSARTGPDGRFTASVRLDGAGTYAVRALAGGSGASTPIQVTVRGNYFDVYVTLTPHSLLEGGRVTTQQVRQAVKIVRGRLQGVGARRFEVTTGLDDGDTVIKVAAAGVDPKRLVGLVEQVALLEFRPVWGSYPPGPASTSSGKRSVAPVQAADNTPRFSTQVANLDCTDPANRSGSSWIDPGQWLGACDVTGGTKYSLFPAVVEGRNVTSATAMRPQGGIGWIVLLEFDSEGARAVAETSTRLTAMWNCSPPGANPCNAIAIVLDGVVVSAPRFNEPILGGKVAIEGNFTEEQARDLATVVAYGAPPVRLEAVTVTTLR